MGRSDNASDSVEIPRTALAPSTTRTLIPYHLLVLLGVLPILGLAVFAYIISGRAVDDLVRSGNDAAATITASMVEREFDFWSSTLTSHAGFPTFSASVSSGDQPEVRRRLGIFVNAHEQIDRAFVTDLTGLLWVDYPRAPESLGRRFDDRDWYEGVASANGPYVSEVYRRNAEPQLHVVAVAVPVSDPETGERAGFMVAQVRLNGLSELLGRVEVGTQGIALMLDHTGAVAAHPTLDVETETHREYAGVVGDIAEAGGGDLARGRYADPVTAETMLASVAMIDVGSHRWCVVAQQPVAAAFAANRTLAWQLGGGGVLLAALLGALVWGLGRENSRRRDAERALALANEDLERRVEERTAALQQKEQELVQSQKMEAVGRLAGGVAHDFNNLLTVIIGTTGVLLEDMRADAPEREDVEQIGEAGERAAALTRQLLAFSRKQVMQPEVLDLNAVVEGMRKLLDRVLGENIGIAWKLSSGLHPVKFDPGQIEQVILNLAVNASDAMPNGGKLTIETDNVELDEDYVADHPDARTGPHAMLAVSDNGVGMDAETRERIFEPFYTTKRLGRGTGLGLSTVYGIVRQGGGNIWVYSEPGRGTTFKIYLPRADDEPAAPGDDTHIAHAAGTGLVLVVEDEDGVRNLLARVLKAAGYDVLEAEDAGRAAALIAEHADAVDLILTDVILPDMSGPELVQQLEREHGRYRVLYMSGYTDDAIVHHGVLEEGTEFIEKPLRPRALLAKVRELLGAED